MRQIPSNLNVRVTDNGGRSYTEALTVDVQDVDRPGTMDTLGGLSNGKALEGTTISAGSITDPDGAITPIAYQWQQSVNGGVWTDISGATSSAYLVDYLLASTSDSVTARLVETYTDAQGHAGAAISDAVAVEDNDQAGSITFKNFFGQRTNAVFWPQR